MWNTFPDSPVPAADILNRAVNEVRRYGRLWTAPPLQSFYSPGIGWLLWVAPTSSNSASAPTGGSFVARLGAGNGNAYAWTEQMRQGDIYVDMPNGASSDLDGSPAYELNGQANIKSGTVVNLVGAMKLDNKTGVWVFHHPRHEHTMHLAADRGRSSDGVGRAFDFGIRRPGYYFNNEPVSPHLPHLCSYCDTDNLVTLPAPFLGTQGTQGVDGIYQLTATGIGGRFSLAGFLPDATPFKSSDINDGDGAAAVVQAIRDSAFTGSFSAVETVPNQDIMGSDLLSAIGGPLGTAPVILTAHENSYWKLLLNSLTVSPPASGSFDTSAAYEVLQEATVAFVLDGFYPSRLTLSVNSGIGSFDMHLGVEQSPPFAGPSYETFDYTGSLDTDGNPTKDFWQIEPVKMRLVGAVTVAGTIYSVGLTTQTGSPYTDPVSATRLTCWPFQVQWLGFTMEGITPAVGGPIPTGTYIGPIDATATGIYF